MRYSSLNFVSLHKYGSLEFRAMRSTPNFDLIYQWVEMLQELRDNVLKTFDSPEDVISSMSQKGEFTFLQRMLPTYWSKVHYRGAEDDIRQSARRIQALAYTIKWNELDKVGKNPFLNGEQF